MGTKECAWCGQAFEYERASRKTHSSACKQALHRWHNKTTKHRRQMKGFMSEFASLNSDTHEKRRLLIMLMRSISTHAMMVVEKLISDDPSLGYMRDLIYGDQQRLVDKNGGQFLEGGN